MRLLVRKYRSISCPASCVANKLLTTNSSDLWKREESLGPELYKSMAISTIQYAIVYCGSTLCTLKDTETATILVRLQGGDCDLIRLRGHPELGLSGLSFAGVGSLFYYLRMTCSSPERIGPVVVSQC